MRLGLQTVLKKEGYKVTMAADGEAAIGMLGQGEGFDLIVTDLKMPKKDGFAVLAESQRLEPAPKVLMITAFGDIPTAVEAMKQGASDFIQKPFQIDDVRTRVRTALAQRELELELEVKVKVEAASAETEAEAEPERDPIFSEFPEIVTQDPAMARVLKLVKKVAPKPCTTLILGETGCGKELIAQALHRLSDRPEAPFIAVNCSALTETLLESELFGHVKGAFTGAHSNKVGLFKAADGGTLFLDEIGDVPMSVQVKLLRVIQEGTFFPVGSTSEVKVKVRLLAATWRDLKAMIRERSFREDLYFRLNVVTVSLPPLRERVGDVPLLVQEFLKRFRAQNGREPLEIDAQALACLRDHSWKGNIRDLKNACQRLAIFCDERVERDDVEQALEDSH
jgi:DNA-binding NtrC family response regulator